MVKKRKHHSSETGLSLYTDNSVSSIAPYTGGNRDQVNPDFRVPQNFPTPEFRPARRVTGEDEVLEDFSYLYWEYDFNDTWEPGIITHYAKHIGEQAIVRIPWSGTDGTPSTTRQGPSSPTPPNPDASERIVDSVTSFVSSRPSDSDSTFNYASPATTAASLNAWMNDPGIYAGAMGYQGGGLNTLEPNRFNGRGDWLTTQSISGSTPQVPLLTSTFGGAPVGQYRLGRYTSVKAGTTYTGMEGTTSQIFYACYFAKPTGGAVDYFVEVTYDFKTQSTTLLRGLRIVKIQAQSLDGLGGDDLYLAIRGFSNTIPIPSSITDGVINALDASGITGGVPLNAGNFTLDISGGSSPYPWSADGTPNGTNWGTYQFTNGTRITDPLPNGSSGALTIYPILAGVFSAITPTFRRIPSNVFTRENIFKQPEFFTTPDIFFGGTKKLYLQKRNNPPILIGTYNIFEPIHTALTPQEDNTVVSVFRGGREIGLTSYDGNSTGDIEAAVHLMNFQRVVGRCVYDEVTQHVVEQNVVTSSTTTTNPDPPTESVWQNLQYDYTNSVVSVDFDFFSGGDIATINGTTSGSGPPEENLKTIPNIADEKDYYESFFGYRYITTHERIFHFPSSDPPGYDFCFDEPGYDITDYYMPVSEFRLQTGNLVNGLFYYVKPADTNFLGGGELGLCSEDPVLTGATSALNQYAFGVKAFPDINTSMLAKATEPNQEDRLVTMYTVQGTWDDGTDTWTETSSQTINGTYALPLLQNITVNKTSDERPDPLYILTAVVYDPYEDPPATP